MEKIIDPKDIREIIYKKEPCIEIKLPAEFDPNKHKSLQIWIDGELIAEGGGNFKIIKLKEVI